MSDSIDQYVEIDLTSSGTYRVTGVKTQGCPSGNCCSDKWVTKYAIQYSDDDIDWKSIVENGGAEKVFECPSC